jgi:flagellin
LVFELGGATGSEVFSVLAGASISELAAQINLVSDATGVGATINGTTLELTSTAYGSAAFVDLSIISEGSGTVPSGTFTTSIGAGDRATGTDAVAKINGIDANANGNSLSLNTATLDLKLDLASGFIGNIAFDITGGGALFQLGPDVVSNQQARIGITSVNTAALGGSSGLLYQLASGGTADLATDATTAATIVEQAIDQVTTLRGRLGAFQRTLLETNKNALSDTLINLTEAQSQIRDADFAAETAALTRAQILVQSGTTVLQVANQSPQNVLALLR